MSYQRRPFRPVISWIGCALLAASSAQADSVAQVATAKRISRQTVSLIDPQGRPAVAPGSAGNTLARVGDVLTFTIQFTPVPNGAFRGMGGYITDYIPPNTEVVGARIVDRNGNTVPPHRGGLACDGYGPRGQKWNTATLVDGSMAQLYADTGIFFSDDPRTARHSRNPGSGLDEPFLTLKNGLQMPQNPSGAGQFDNLLSTSAPYFAHNEWDLAQVVVFGPASGNAPEHVGNSGIGYGSPVAGPDSWYQLEQTVDPPAATIIAANSKALGNVGPWRRIRTTGGEIGQRGQGADPPTAPSSMTQCPGNAPTRVGVPAVDGSGTLLGWDLSTSNPLPPNTNAVRFALGELVVGDEYFAEISLRVKALPLDPTFGDVNCAEVAGGDASSRRQDGSQGGKDYLWRYFLPAPACVSLDLLFENNVDKVLVAANGALTNTIEVKNLSTTTQTGVVVKDCYSSGDETFVSAGSTGGYTLDTAGTGCPNPAVQDAIVWTVGTLAPGEGRSFTLNFTGTASTSNQAVYTSDALPSPGFVATAYTTVGNTAIMRLALEAAPVELAALPGVVHYTAQIANVGTANATTLDYGIRLPDTSWTYRPGSALVNGVPASLEPAQTGAVLHFGAPPAPASISAGGSLTLEFDVDVAASVSAGEYTSSLTSFVNATQDLEDSIFAAAPVAVLMARSETPSLSATLLEGATQVSGTSAEAAGSTLTVFVNGNPAGSTSVTGSGSFSASIPALFAGQRVTARARATGELESFSSAAVTVVGVGGVAACLDGLDNDGDGQTDFPNDLGCSSAYDADETDVAECSDGLDNDGDGKSDFPEDESCSSYLDGDEAGAPACSDGADNDGDGALDFPDDPGCTAASDASEADTPACSDGSDNDGDGRSDFPNDLGCTSSLDDSEQDASSGAGGSSSGGAPGTGASASGAGSASALGGGLILRGAQAIPDPGGVPASEASAGAKRDGGCSCKLESSTRSQTGGWVAMLAALTLLGRRRRAAR